jgi:mannosyltransferase OCH1-like enzyme
MSENKERAQRIRQYKQRWKERNPDYGRILWQRTKERVFEAYGHRCAKCGFSDKRALQLDHVQDDGYKHRIIHSTGRKSNKTQAAWYDAMRHYQPDRYQILCANCNWIKRYEHSGLPIPKPGKKINRTRGDRK